MHYFEPASGSFHVNYLLNQAPNGASGTKTDDLNGTSEDDFQSWEYLGTWWKESQNATSSNTTFGIVYGFNKEVANIQNIDKNGVNNVDGEMFHTFGSEWTDQWDYIVGDAPAGEYHHDMHWASGEVTLDNVTQLPVFIPTMSGFLDWGISAYAAAGQTLPASSSASTKSGVQQDRWISYVWLTGNLYGKKGYEDAPAATWTGALCLPRELTVGYINNVVDNELSREVPGAWVVESTDDFTGTLSLKTLRQVIAREPLAAMRGENSSLITEPAQQITSPSRTPFSHSPTSRHFILTANLTFPSSARTSDLRAGLRILESEHESTTIWYKLSNETLLVDRSKSSAAAATTGGTKVDIRPEKGLIRLFDVLEDGNEAVEALRLTVVVDNSIVEIHANDRFALSTWIKPWYSASTNISFFAEGTGSVEFSEIFINEGLYDAFPRRTYEGVVNSNSTADHSSAANSTRTSLSYSDVPILLITWGAISVFFSLM
ncbi:beta-fructofuranosidase [Diaporthe helianthi]|uniref:Beta-fructofuranosidase n=1 Tax=Diaporthe helianthi TaxID=158607 RepID=A0A2P5HGU1_DIAHE|nr:beta-fructofuranosidase [Diaporthe helianthi]